MKVKYIVFAVLAMFSFSGCDEKYAKVPLTVPVDFSKKGTVYETDFKAPWNIWGSKVSFGLGASYEINSKLTQEQEKIYYSIRTGHRGNFLIPKEENQYFKLRVTLISLSWASDDVMITFVENGIYTDKLYTKGRKIEEIVSVPLYGGDIGYGKVFMIADLQRLRNYHIRVESLEDVELPKGVSTKFEINKYSVKH